MRRAPWDNRLWEMSQCVFYKDCGLQRLNWSDLFFAAIVDGFGSLQRELLTMSIVGLHSEA